MLIGCSLSLSCALVYLGAMFAGLVAVPVEDRALRDSAVSLLKATGAKAVWTELAVRGDWTEDASTICLEGNLGNGTVSRSCRPPLVRLPIWRP